MVAVVPEVVDDLVDKEDGGEGGDEVDVSEVGVAVAVAVGVGVLDPVGGKVLEQLFSLTYSSMKARSQCWAFASLCSQQKLVVPGDLST
jgi:hypothetical protein